MTMPRNLRSWRCDCGWGNSLMSATFAAIGRIPEALMWCPRKSRDSTAKWHFVALMVMPLAAKRWKMISRWRRCSSSFELATRMSSMWNAWQRVATYKSGSQQTWRCTFSVLNYIEKPETDRTKLPKPISYFVVQLQAGFLAFFLQVQTSRCIQSSCATSFVEPYRWSIVHHCRFVEHIEAKLLVSLECR